MRLNKMSGEDFSRLANNFYTSNNIEVTPERMSIDNQFCNYVSSHEEDLQKKFKVAFVFICLNPLYWEFAPAMVQGAKQFFLPGHKTDFLFWTDIPNDGWEVYNNLFANFRGVLASKGIQNMDENTFNRIGQITSEVVALRKRDDVTIIPTVASPWPYPTLLRYNLFLQEEDKLKDYDYIFYCDVDMQFRGIVGDEILGNITSALHPMYALRKEYWPPYEPNEQSEAYIKRPGKILNEGGKQRFMPMYYAGGFQGGKSETFIRLMKEARKKIDADLSRNYIPVWNDETVWNKVLEENIPDVVLSPAYIYPDSLVEEYYKPLWGRDYQPKLVTLTKWFSTSPEGGQAVAQMIKK